MFLTVPDEYSSPFIPQLKSHLFLRVMTIGNSYAGIYKAVFFSVYQWG
jgi:hypothetical protein